MKLKRVTDDGLLRFRNLIAADSGSDFGDRQEEILGILDHPEFLEDIAEAGTVDIDLEFASNYDFVKHVWPALEPIVANRGPKFALENRGLNGFLGIAFVRQMTHRRQDNRPQKDTADGEARQRKAFRVPSAFVLDLHTVTQSKDDQTRNYRNTIFALLNFYHLYQDQDALCREVLATKVGQLSNALESLCQRGDAMCSLGTWNLMVAMFMSGNGTGALHRPDRKKLPKSDLFHGTEDVMQKVATMLSSQTSRNWDLEGMTAREIHGLIPDSPDLAYWKRRGAERLGIST
jgi:hypothetical protein